MTDNMKERLVNGEFYYFIKNGVICQTEEWGHCFDDERWASGNYYATRAEAEAVLGIGVKDEKVDPTPVRFVKDAVHPSHYKQYPIEVIEMMRRIWGDEATKQWCIMTAFKYRMRMGHKDDVRQEMEKEEWYLNKASEL